MARKIYLHEYIRHMPRIGVISILIVFLLFLWLSRKHGNPVQKTVKRAVSIAEGKVPIEGGDGRDYYVLANKPEPHNAVELIAEINSFMISLILALKNKYLYSEKTCFTEPSFRPEDEFVPYDSACAVDDPLSDFRIRAVYLLVTRYRPNYLEENQPTSPHDTSWEEGKGERIALCLREQASGKYGFIDKELIKFVAIHELTHIAANTLDHPYYFWKVFKFLLIEANELLGFNLYDFKRQPINYCGMVVSYNPVYDSSVNIMQNESRDITAV